MERESGALGGLFQQIIQDMKVGTCKITSRIVLVLGIRYRTFMTIKTNMDIFFKFLIISTF